MSNWQSIDTAPKNGATILLFGTQKPHPHVGASGAFPFSGYWDRLDEEWCSTASDWTGQFYTPSHWMPMPEIPDISPTSPDVHTHADGGEG